MTARELVLASASPARLRLLELAGLRPRVEVSDFDESSLTAADPADLVEQLACAKARIVAERCSGPLVLGCDSMLAIDGQVLGRAEDPADVVERWRAFRGRQGELLTGHCLIDTAAGGAEVSAVGRTVVRFGTPDDAEIEAYARTTEALSVAGPFTIDGRAAAFVEGIDGNAGNVIGLSVPMLRDLLSRLGVRITDLWDAP